MAPREKKTRIQKLDPRIKALHSQVGLIWKCAALLAFVGGVCLIVGAASAEWLVLDAYTIRYQGSLLKPKPKTQVYQNAYLGLYLTYFNGGTSIVPWYQKVSSVCGGYAELVDAAVTAGTINLYDSACSTNCVGHFKTRCSVYKQLATIGYLGLAGYIGGACLTILGAAWLFIFGKSKQFLQYAWIGSGIIGIILASYWLFSINMFGDQLNVLSFYPRWTLGYSFYIACVGSLLCLLSGIIVAFAASMDSRSERKIKEELIIMKEVGEGGLELPPGAMSYAQQRNSAQFVRSPQVLGTALGHVPTGARPSLPPLMQQPGARRNL